MLVVWAGVQLAWFGAGNTNTDVQNADIYNADVEVDVVVCVQYYGLGLG